MTPRGASFFFSSPQCGAPYTNFTTSTASDASKLSGASPYMTQIWCVIKDNA